MHSRSLSRFVEQTRQLPGGGPAPGDAAGVQLRAADRDAGDAPAPSLEPSALRARVGALLHELGARLDEALPRTLARAASAWDQIDSFTVMDAPLGAEVTALRRASAALAADEDAARRAVGIESRLMVDTAAGLVSLVERRLATLVRLRLRSETPDLIVEGQPFLELAGALAEAAREWA